MFTPNRRTILRGAAMAAASSALAPYAFASESQWAGYGGATVVDAQSGIGPSDPKAGPEGHMSAKDWENVRASGITLLSQTVCNVGNIPDSFEGAVATIAWCDHELTAHPDLALKVLSAADINRARTEKKFGFIYNFQDTWPLGPNLDRVGVFQDLGVRIIQLTYNKRNLVGDGCLEPANAGLSVFGHQMVEALNAHRILVDLSHSGQRTIAEGIAASKAPPVISHTGARSLVDFPRNTYDAELKALAEKGGVAGVYFMPFLRASGQPRGEDALKHFDHFIDVCGEDHVGIGTDGGVDAIVVDKAFKESHRKFVADRRAAGIMAPGEDENVYNYVPEYNGPRKFDRLAFDFSKRGYSDARIEKILGGNFARVFAEVWG